MGGGVIAYRWPGGVTGQSYSDLGRVWVTGRVSE